MTLDVARVQADFPILKRQVHGRRLVYLDSASSSQKPTAVLDTMDRLYRESYANVHRGVYQIAEEATAAYEGARARLARFVGAASPSEIVFTRNVTEAINLVAYSWGRANLQAGDVVVLTELEHHANIVPWHILAAERGVELRWVPLGEDFRLDLSGLDRLLDGAKLFAFSAASNVLGTMTDVRSLVDAAHAAGARALVDAAQYAPHRRTTGHKMLGPTAIGALWARPELLEAMPPFLGGGEMIRDVRQDGFTPNEVPWKFEAGTMPIAEAVGLAAAIDYLDTLGMDDIAAHEVALTSYALRALEERFGERLSIYGPRDVEQRGATISFLFEGIHAHDISQVVDEHGVCVRAGHHCAKPLMRVLGVPATTRASFYVYNDEADVDALVEALAAAERFFAI